MPKKSAFPMVSLYHLDKAVLQHNGQHEAGETAARSQVDPMPRSSRAIQELQRICDVPGPHVVKRTAADKVLDLLPALKQLHVLFKTRNCFT
jgi:hypothetical protein